MNLTLASSTRDNVKLRVPGSLGDKTSLDEGNRVRRRGRAQALPFSSFREI